MKTARMPGLWGGAVLLFAGLFLHTVYAQGPDTITLDDMTQYYASVEFDHLMHVDLLGEENCAVCHHHTLGTPLVDENCMPCHAASKETDSVACRECHQVKRFSAEYLAKMESNIRLHHVDKPGLKGAFHQRCLGCHMEMGIASDCQVCHARSEEGNRFFHAGANQQARAETSSDHK